MLLLADIFLGLLLNKEFRGSLVDKILENR